MQYSWLDRPNWRLQSKTRVQAGPSILNAGGFSAWTDVAPGSLDETRGRRELHQRPTGREFNPTGMVGGRRHNPAYAPSNPELRGKRTYVPRTKSLEGPTTAEVPRGVRRLQVEPAATANPSAAKEKDTPKPPVRAQSAGLTRKDDQQDKAARVRSAGLTRRSQNGGEFVWGGGLRVAKDGVTGRSLRSAETPMAWPKHYGYPPSHDASGAPIDYALEKYGGAFRTKPPEHPDVTKSRRNRAIASDKSYPNQNMRARNAGVMYY